MTSAAVSALHHWSPSLPVICHAKRTRRCLSVCPCAVIYIYNHSPKKRGQNLTNRDVQCAAQLKVKITALKLSRGDNNRLLSMLTCQRLFVLLFFIFFFCMRVAVQTANTHVRYRIRTDRAVWRWRSTTDLLITITSKTTANSIISLLTKAGRRITLYEKGQSYTTVGERV